MVHPPEGSSFEKLKLRPAADGEPWVFMVDLPGWSLDLFIHQNDIRRFTDALQDALDDARVQIVSSLDTLTPGHGCGIYERARDENHYDW
tara:strand:+ start:2470 stop:2739 length:270 start_codon:yes stop_codon:yes gene_type:complete